MRRTPTRRLAIAAVAASLALTLTACGGGDDSADGSTATPTAPTADAPTAPPTPTAEDIQALADVTVEGEPGTQPTITLPSTPFTVSATVARAITEGEGDPIAAGDNLEVQLTAVSGADGSKLVSTYDDKATSTYSVGTDGAGIPALDDVLTSVGLNAQVLFAITSQGETRVYVLEPVSKIKNAADGTPVAPVDGLPTVTLAEDGTPTITAATGDAPTELVTQTLLQGAGKEVEAGDNVLVQYSGALWDGTPFDSSWSRGQAFPLSNIGSAQVIAGWNQGLVGTHVGDQVLLVVPPDLGYGDKDSGTIPAGSTLVFVVDVLWAS